MCGFAGFVHGGTETDLRNMMGELVHRGPDGDGLYFDSENKIGLGHRRLAIIDVKGGHQPMWNDDASIGVVFNGEIYNHALLRSGLEERGHRFTSHHSDTEVLIHGWREWGEDLPKHLNGMFAFTIVDRVNRRLFSARDRFGEKPFYYIKKDGLFAFASEINALARHAKINLELDIRHVQKYFAYGYVPAPNTIYKDIQKLSGGTYVDYNYSTKKIGVGTFTEFQLQQDETLMRRSVEDLAEEFWELFSNSVSRRLMSDVPLGVFLSGGIDSTAVLAAMSEHKDMTTVSTFTVGFKESTFDESDFALAVANHFGTKHHREILDLPKAQRLLDEVLPKIDEPIADASIIPTYLLASFTRQHVTVALSGDGGDELMAGYDPFAALRPGLAYQRVVPHKFHRLVKSLVSHLPASPKNMSLEFKLKKTLNGLSYPPSLWNPVWLSPLLPELVAELFSDPLSVEELYSEAIVQWEKNSELDTIDRSLAFYTKFYLENDILPKVDRASMLNSLESRAVFLDNDLVDFICRLPNCFKLRGNVRKFLLKEALKHKIDSRILNRKKKGFGIPTASWLRKIGQPQVGTELFGIEQKKLDEMWSEHASGEADHRLFLWGWLSLSKSVSKHQLSTLP